MSARCGWSMLVAALGAALGWRHRHAPESEVVITVTFEPEHPICPVCGEAVDGIHLHGGAAVHEWTWADGPGTWVVPR